MDQAMTLYELNNLVRSVLATDMPDAYWVEAEISEVREVRGNCYMELVEKDVNGHTPIAKASAKCWKTSWFVLRSHFERVVGRPLSVGMKVLLKVTANFHEAFGFSWIVEDLDPTYTVGDMARKRQEIINQLKMEGVFELQKELKIPMFVQRIAVISSQNAAGYGDFCNQLANNKYHFSFEVELFPATMQGEGIEKSVIAALNSIYDRISDFDVVVLIRGGGATSDLSGFDTLALAENIANFPLPIITGIGHERDESVLDMISNMRVKTPTAAATFLVEHLSEIHFFLEAVQEKITTSVSRLLQMEKMRVNRFSSQLPVLFSLIYTRQLSRIGSLANKLSLMFKKKISDETHRLDLLDVSLLPLMENRILGEKHRLELLEKRVEAMDPKCLLKKGYSITTYKGKVVKDSSLLPLGAEIETIFEKGSVTSTVKKYAKEYDVRGSHKEIGNNRETNRK